MPNDYKPEVLFSNYMRVRRFWDQLGLDFKPKLHQGGHLIERIQFTGNPDYTACWEDEAFNRIMGVVGRALHAKNFEHDFLLRFDETQGNIAEFRKDYSVDVDFAKRRRRSDKKSAR